MSTPDEGRYSRVSRRIWNDERFRELSQPKPSGAWLFFRLLTGPELSCIPGLFQAWDGGLARALRWSLKDLEKCWKEIAAKELAFADWEAGLVWLPNAIHHNEPANPNVVLSWRTAWKELPECKLKADAEAELQSWCEARGDSWAKAFYEVVGKDPLKGPGKGSAKAFSKGPSKQEQDQDPEQDQQPAAAVIKDLTRGGPTQPGPAAAAAAEIRNQAEAEKVPIRERAAYLLRNKQTAPQLQPGKWAECQALGVAVTAAFCQKWHGFGQYERDSGLRAAVELLTMFDWPDLELAIERAKTDPYFADPKRHGLSSFSLEVVRRLLSTPRRAEERQDSHYTYFCDGTRLCRADIHDAGCRAAETRDAAQ